MPRADSLLAERGFFESRAKARAAIEAGLVTADGIAIAKPSQEIAREAEIIAESPHPFVSRGGVKLDFALDHFSVDAKDRYCLDLGASTGGFTDALLQRGARHVVAVDVGSGQLHPRIAEDPRVRSYEKLDARDLAPAHLVEPPSLVVCDASFISLTLLLERPLSLAAKEATLVALIKPQFESGRGAGKKGVVRDAAAHEAACKKIAETIVALGWRVVGIAPSPIMGGEGNREFLICGQRP
ncbi:TlyA family RNA methyltransferase [Methylocystis bryophila]|uniref:TlyA family rRNA (Cytidine-2'-O)-methyltransferase n=1 Tax=Methylocystis bryophila TaxID=655015 RepID=A0A1W6MWA4_9HYPH|nr:TlyA family RNA methyltransferase [Methylocystis bryophila]ARN81872.1 TlyA family rRNA (cytidine-2'-O)-methyltransferase [Methylocystis bryophila]BDV37951.1 TlyA family rRNA (cytidine-2'-O)-methyltransferase [Methylocystis bryophila]